MYLQMAMLYVKDLSRMASFYELVLGMAPAGATRSAGWAEFSMGAVRFGLHAIPAAIAEGIVITSPPQVREEIPCKLLFAVKDVEAEAVRLEGLGVTIFRRPWGSCDGVDPEGNVFGICAECAAPSG